MNLKINYTMKRYIFTVGILLVSLFTYCATISVLPGTGTIAAAIEQAAAGDELVLAQGEYVETSTLKVDKALTIRGAEGAQVLVHMSRYFELNASATFSNLYMIATAKIDGIRKGSTSTFPDLTMQNCTMVGFDRAIYLSAPNNTEQHSVTIDHCTFYHTTSTRGIYLADVNGATISNCIFMNPEYDATLKSYCIYGVNSVVKNSISYQADAYIRSGASSTNLMSGNPLFVDAEKGDFQLYKNSPAVGAGTDGSTLGDPRWGVSEKNADKSSLPLVLVKKPWSMSPTTTSVRILWETEDAEDASGRVKYGTTPELGLEQQSSDGWSISGEGYVHVVELTGLQPNTRYYYQVGDDARMYELVCSTKTAPLAGTAYRIFTLSDIHENSCSNWQNMQSNICALEPDIAIFNGDFINKGDSRPWNSAFFVPGEPFLEQTPIMSSPGNHETGDPTSYRYSTFYDYFSQFSHGYSEDAITDPRGESYYTFPYGNTQVVVININGDASSPQFGPGSRQYQWLDSVLTASSLPWTLVFGHVGIMTSGYHGQWSAEPKQIAPMLEKHAKAGKHIIYLCGDDHSFEHLYKDGVHYVRPGCGRNSNYVQQTQLVDAQYSMFYRQISCYSTLDVAQDGSAIHLTARDSASNVFYEYTFELAGNVITPSVTFTAPIETVEVADSVMISWFSFDPAKDGKISFYYSASGDGKNGTLIASGIGADPKAQKRLWWQTRDVYPKGEYYVHAIIESAAGKDTAYLSHPVLLVEDTIAPPAPMRMAGNIVDGKYVVRWQNPTHPIHVDNTLQDFSQDYSGFVADGDHGSAQLSIVDGALQVDYTVTEAWGEGSACYVFEKETDLSGTPIITFRLKGDGATRSLRLVVKNMAFGHEDWWYTEAFSLSSKDWKTCTIDLRTLASFDWYSNSELKNEMNGVVQICFIVPSSSTGSGTMWLDDIHLSGDILPCSDFAGTVIIRRDDRFAENAEDGQKVYDGTAENCVDAEADTDKYYYYSAFSYDDRQNYSSATASAQWYSSELTVSLDDVVHAKAPRKFVRSGQLYIRVDDKTYNAQGM